MPSCRLTVTVPQPCSEDWNAMVPQNQGRFCQSCSKTVVDFTAMPDAEVVNWLAKQKGNTCGKFKEEQLGRTLISESKFKNTWTARALLFGLAMWFGKGAAEAQKLTTQKSKIELLTSSKPSVLASSINESNTVISGVVLAAPEGGASQIKIRLNDTVETSADASGHFKVIFSKSMPLEQQWLVISAIGYKSQRLRLSDLENLQEVKVALQSDDVPSNSLQGILGGISVSGIPVKGTSFPQNLYYRIEDFFR